MTSPKKEGNRSGLIVFVKNPELSKVKTRLAADVGDTEALAIYNQLLDHTRAIAKEVATTRYLFYSDHIENDDWDDHLFHKEVQASGDLGNRMLNAFGHVLNDKKNAVIIGSDCAQLTSIIVKEAFNALDQYDIVIGPTYDGGYYLLGMKVVHPQLFQNMQWSVDDVFSITISRIQELDLSVKVLEKLSDIDTKEDWEQYGFFE